MKITIEITIDDSRATVTVNGVPQPATWPLLNVTEASRRLGITTKRVRTLIDQGLLGAVDIGLGKTHKWRIAESDLLAYANTSEATE